jgi:predicted component of type VI protein secretion system
MKGDGPAGDNNSSVANGFGPGHANMPARLVALDEGPDIPLDRAMVVVGRHPQCDARLDSLRISRHHCCMTTDQGEVVVRDLGSTNGIRINGQRVEMGRLRPGDELSIAHIRFRLDDGQHQEMTMADAHPKAPPVSPGLSPVESSPFLPSAKEDNPLAAAVRELLPAGMADRCRIQVIVQMPTDSGSSAAEKVNACRPDSSP